MVGVLQHTDRFRRRNFGVSYDSWSSPPRLLFNIATSVATHIVDIAAPSIRICAEVSGVHWSVSRMIKSAAEVTVAVLAVLEWRLVLVLLLALVLLHVGLSL